MKFNGYESLLTETDLHQTRMKFSFQVFSLVSGFISTNVYVIIKFNREREREGESWRNCGLWTVVVLVRLISSPVLFLTDVAALYGFFFTKGLIQ